MVKSYALAALALLLSSAALASNNVRTYEVTITNVTKGQTFTPQLVTTHSASIRLFSLGQPASQELEILAEGGDTQPLTDLLLSYGNKVGDVQTIPGLLGPGQSARIVVSARGRQVLSLAAMLIPTNDTFVALDRVRLPRHRKSQHHGIAYDAGSEANDQSCGNIPGPRCGGEGASLGPEDGDEGYVYVGNGFHDLGDEDADGNEVLGPLPYDWRNPVAHVTVRLVSR